MASLPEYEVYAIRYASREGERAEAFIEGDPQNGPMTIDYFVWVVRSPERTFVIDCGLSDEAAARRKRTLLRSPVESLRLFGVQPESVSDLIITHLHNDHAGNFDKFPNARFHLQRREMAFVTGPYMRERACSRPYEIEDIVKIVRLNFDGRVEMHDGDAQLADGLSIHLTGGHSDGLQFVRVWTRRGWLVVASDVAHFYANLETRRPVRVMFNVGDALDGFRAVERASASPDHIVPGHDGLVMKKYPAPRPDLEGIAVRLD